MISAVDCVLNPNYDASMDSLTELLTRLNSGDSDARQQLFPLVYDELRMLAAKKLADEKPGQTLQATALVNELFLKLVKVDRWESRRHFFAVAAEAMRHILVDQARKKLAAKRGAGFNRKELSFCDVTSPEKPREMLAISEALEELALTNAGAAEIVKLRFFVGLSTAEAAEMMNISLRSANRLWASARAWLAVELKVDR